MAKAEKGNFLKGPVTSSILRFSLPVLGALVLQAAYGAVDLLVVGQFGTAASVSGVATGSSIMHVITIIITALSTGCTVIIGHHIGEKKPEEAGKTIGTTIIVFAVFGLVLTILLEVFAADIARIMNVPEAAYDKCVEYVRICSAGILVITAYNVISGILRGAGNAKLPLLFVFIACVVNIIGDIVLVGPLHMDAAGAAIATIAAQTVSVISSLLVLRKMKLPFIFKKKHICLDKREFRLTMKIGFPMALQEFLVQISFLVVNSVINEMGLMQSAGYGIAQRVASFILLVPLAASQSVSAFVAQNYGAGQMKRAKKGYLNTMIIGVLFGTVLFFLSFFMGDKMAWLFNKEEAVVAQAYDYIRGFSFDCILTCILFTSGGYFNGCGHSLPVMLQGITSAMLIRLPLSILFSRMPNTSLFYVGLATPLATVYGIVFYMICLIIVQKKDKRLGIT